MSDTQSITTSLLAERVVEQIGRRKEPTGSVKILKNLKMFCGDSLTADCCQKNTAVGF